MLLPHNGTNIQINTNTKRNALKKLRNRLKTSMCTLQYVDIQTITQPRNTLTDFLPLGIFSGEKK
jgi:hypothetical protein